MSRRLYDRREGRKSARFIDRTGMIAHRLLYLEWLGKWHGKHFWLALCDCGRKCEVEWRVSDVRSCGCLQREHRQNHGWETQRTDGRWGLKTEKRLVLADGTVTTAAKLCQQIGLSKGKMLWRVRNWPESRWLEPPHHVGARIQHFGKAPIVKTGWHRRPQPWAAATMHKINADGRAYRKTGKPDHD